MNRRTFLQNSSALSVASMFGFPGGARAEPLPETTRIRLVASPAICLAPQFVAEPLLRLEGFTEIEYVKINAAVPWVPLASGDADISMDSIWTHIVRVDAGDPLVALAGMHLGCYELFGTQRINALRDLKGKSIPVGKLGSPEHLFFSVLLAYVGLDPNQDIRWLERTTDESVKLLAEEKVDAVLAFPPLGQELRARGIGRLIVDTTVDRPWMDHFCCMLVANRAFMRSHPIATRRTLRALLKAADLCRRDPAGVARLMVEKGFAAREDYARQTLQDVTFTAWRTHDPEDTVRFMSLRLRETGFIKGSPRKIIADGTDWRFLNELKKELKT